MYDELIAEINETRDDCRDSDFIESAYVGELLGKAADVIEELQGKADAYLDAMTYEHNRAARLLWDKEHCWIPVTERLPEAGERVLCYCRANIYEVMKMRTDGDWVYDTNHVYMHSFVTHWMPLPQPPKEE